MEIMKKIDKEAKKLWVFQVCFPAADRNIYRMEAGRRGLLRRQAEKSHIAKIRKSLAKTMFGYAVFFSLTLSTCWLFCQFFAEK